MLACSKQKKKIRKRPLRARSVQTTNLEVVAKRVLEPKVIFSRAQGDAGSGGLYKKSGVMLWLLQQPWQPFNVSEPPEVSQYQLQLSLTLIFNHNRNFTSLTLRHYQRLSFWECAFLSFPPHLSKSMQFLISIKNLDENLPGEEFSAMQQNTIQVLLSLSLIFYVQQKTFSS